MKKIVCVVGPTASGKTRFAIDYAKEHNGEIVSCDSMQIYKYMDIGTAKATEAERAEVRHHMIDFLEPDISYSVADFVKDAIVCIDDILSRDRLPVLCGGTGLYVDSIINNVSFSEEEKDDEYREELKEIERTKGKDFLYEMLKKADEEEARKVHPNNVKRVMRALEICKTRGMTKTESDRLSLGEKRYDAKIYGLSVEREVLYDRINKRVDKMIEDGLLEEVKKLLSMGIKKEATSMQAIGYKELVRHLEGELSYDEAIELIKRESRHYAKRQMTWFRRNPSIQWLVSV